LGRVGKRTIDRLSAALCPEARAGRASDPIPETGSEDWIDPCLLATAPPGLFDESSTTQSGTSVTPVPPPPTKSHERPPHHGGNPPPPHSPGPALALEPATLLSGTVGASLLSLFALWYRKNRS
jgi:hypothetical protein